jgi:hypothetical protein
MSAGPVPTRVVSRPDSDRQRVQLCRVLIEYVTLYNEARPDEDIEPLSKRFPGVCQDAGADPQWTQRR